MLINLFLFLKDVDQFVFRLPKHIEDSLWPKARSSMENCLLMDLDQNNSSGKPSQNIYTIDSCESNQFDIEFKK